MTGLRYSPHAKRIGVLDRPPNFLEEVKAGKLKLTRTNSPIRPVPQN
jgi:hypothetical protein